MARHLSGARALALGIAAATLAPLALAAPATALPSGTRTDLDALRSRTGLVVSGQSATSGEVSSRARHVTTSSPDQTQAPFDGSRTSQGRVATSGPSGVRLAAASTSTATATDCADGVIDPNVLAERSVVHVAYTGASSLTLMRRRDGGAWRTVGTVKAASGVVTDRGVNQRVGYQYRLVAKSGTTTLRDCVESSWFGTWTENGWGDADAVVAGSAGLFQQSPYSLGDRVSSSEFVSPAFSTDGRLLAATRVIDGTTRRAVLEVRKASTGAVVFTVDLGTSSFPADPAFSPDGQTLAFARYDSAGKAQGLGFVDVFGGHTVRILTTSTRIAEPVWRADGTTLVVTTYGAPTDGLGLVCTTCSTVTPIGGTAGGYTPEIGPDGSIWFGWSDGTTNALRKRVPSGTVTNIRTSSTDYFYQPRFSPDGTLYVERDTPDTADPSSYTVGIFVAQPVAGGTDDPTSFGAQRVSTTVAGWDIRQPQSKGTSDFVAEAHHDVVGRDSSGALWAYRNVGTTLRTRTKIGSGWGGFTAILAAGDLNGDDQADLVGRDAKGALWLYRGKAAGGFAARTALGTGWNGYTLAAPGDLNGDDKADLVARDGSGRLWLYPGTGRGTLGARTSLGTGWGGMTALLGTGDVDFDNRADLVARDSSGRLWLYPGNGTGGFLARRQIGSGWSSFTGLAVTEVTYGRPMFFARQKDGTLITYEMTGDGTFSSGDVYRVGTGWNGLTFTA